MSTRENLTDGQRRALYFAVAVVVAGMAMGFVSSFTTLYDAARAHAWTFPWLLPLAVDSGILAYVVLDHLAVTLGARSRWLHLAAWALAAFTVWANAVVSPADGTVWRVIHAAMPALWVLGVEALRYTWRRLHEVPAGSDAIPRGRWLAAPWPTLRLWRRMRLSNITSYPYAVALSEASALARALVSADPGWQEAPVLLRSHIRAWHFPGMVHTTIRVALDTGTVPDTDTGIETWVRKELTRPDKHSAALSSDRTSIAREAARAAHETVPEITLVTGHEPAAIAGPVTGPRDRTKKLPKPAPRKMTDDELMPYVRDLLAAGPGASLGAVRRATGTGPERARKLLDRGKAEHPYIAAVQ